MKYEGIMTALVTPILEDGRVDEEGLKELINFQVENDVQSLLILGGTGEYTALDSHQRKRVIDIALREVDGRLPVVVGILSPGVDDTVDMGLYAKSAGADSIMVVTPYYVHPEQRGIIEYYRILDEHIDMPILLYNIPYRTGVNILPETVEIMVGEIENIVGIKECHPSLGQVTELIKRVGDKISILCGEEFFALSEFILGAHGGVLASANIVPNVWVKLWEFVQQGKINEAVEIHLKYFPLFKAIFMETNPGPLKEAMKLLDLPSGVVKAPLLSPESKTIDILNDLIEELQLRQ